MNSAILFTGRAKAVAFIGRQNILHRKATIAQRNHDLLGLAPVHARIVGSLRHQQRRLDLVGGVERRFLHQHRLAFRRARIAHAL